MRIDNAEGLGTGFLVTSAYLVTAFHVVALGRPLRVTAADGTEQAGRVVATDRAHDLALLELEHPIAGAAPLVAETQPAPVGTPVIAIGHPFALLDRVNRTLDGLLYWTATQGIISERSEEFVQTDAAVNPGNSGGPLLACDGHVLGLVTAKLGGEGVGFAVPMPAGGGAPGERGAASQGVLHGPVGAGGAGRRPDAARPVVHVVRRDRRRRGPRVRHQGDAAPRRRPVGHLHAGHVADLDRRDPQRRPCPGQREGFRVLGELDETYRALLFQSARSRPTS